MSDSFAAIGDRRCLSSTETEALGPQSLHLYFFTSLLLYFFTSLFRFALA
jgi:hypothetical protein